MVKELREYRPVGDEDVDQQWRAQLRDAFAAITTQRKDLDAQLVVLTAAVEPADASDPRLLDQLPIIEGDLGKVPEDIERDLFDAFQLQIRYHHPTRRVTVRHRRRGGNPHACRSRPGDWSRGFEAWWH